MSIKLKDIAQLTGVSIATVSLVLNDKPIRISEEKRQEIIETAKKMNYTVNVAARTLVTKKSNVLGLIIPDIENVFFSKLAKNLEEICIENGYVLLILISNEKLKNDLLLIDILISRQVDGIFLCPSNESLNSDRLLSKIRNISKPVILVDRYFSESDLNKVYFDNTSGSYEAVKYLINKGHKRIAIIASPIENKSKNPRLEGYLSALRDHNINIDDQLIFYGDYKFQSGYAVSNKILSSKATAVFSCNDMMTLGFLKGIQEKNKKVPTDISIVSYDNILEDFTFGIGVTSVIQDTEILAKESFKTYKRFSEKKKVYKKILKTKMIERNSVQDLNT